MSHASDYRAAGVPVWPNRYGLTATRRLIAGTTLLDAVVFTSCGMLLRLQHTALLSLIILSALITALALWCWLRPHQRHDFMLFKAASFYMLLAFSLLAAGSLLR